MVLAGVVLVDKQRTAPFGRPQWPGRLAAKQSPATRATTRRAIPTECTQNHDAVSGRSPVEGVREQPVKFGSAIRPDNVDLVTNRSVFSDLLAGLIQRDSASVAVGPPSHVRWETQAPTIAIQIPIVPWPVDTGRTPERTHSQFRAPWSTRRIVTAST